MGRKKKKRGEEDIENWADVSRKILEEGGSGRRMKSRERGVTKERGAKAFLFLSASSNIAEPRSPVFRFRPRRLDVVLMQ